MIFPPLLSHMPARVGIFYPENVIDLRSHCCTWTSRCLLIMYGMGSKHIENKQTTLTFLA